ncbi:Uncharacterised protein [Bordetella pertussis]|nr:Uncharacterised protein [Bordetella pertussis]
MPLAPPLRSGGASASMARMLGAWKKPKPAPHSAMRQPRSKASGAAGNATSDSRPAASTAMPMPPSRPGGWRSDSAGQGVIRKPVCTWV